MLLNEITTRMASDGLGTVKTTTNNPATWPIYRGGLSDEAGAKDEAIGVAIGPSDPPTDTMGSTVGATEIENQALVVQVRSFSQETALTKAEACWRKLHKLGNVDLSSTRYFLLLCRGQPFPVGRDDKGRWIVGFNVSVSKEQS